MTEFLDYIEITEDMFRYQQIPVEDILLMLKSGKLSFFPKKHKRGWGLLQKECFLNSCLYLPITDYLLIDGSDENWVVVKGENMLTTLSDCLQRNSRISLTAFQKRKLWQKRLPVIIINPGTDSLCRLKIYIEQTKIQNKKLSQECCDYLCPGSYDKMIKKK